MSKSRSFLSRYARIALLAMLWQIVAMPLSNAMAASGGMPGEVPVCTASGIKWVKIGEQTPAQDKEFQRGHCPLCVVGHDSPALIESRSAVAIPVSIAQEANPPALELPVVPIVLAAPPPARAPPLAS